MDDLAEKLKQRALSMKQYEKMTEEQEEGEWIPPPSDSLKKDKDSKVEFRSLLSYSVALFLLNRNVKEAIAPLNLRN
jgi:hypothetical protein